MFQVAGAAFFILRINVDKPFPAFHNTDNVEGNRPVGRQPRIERAFCNPFNCPVQTGTISAAGQYCYFHLHIFSPQY